MTAAGIRKSQVEVVRSLFLSGRVSDARAASVQLEDGAVDEDSWFELFALFKSVKDNARAEIVTSKFLSLRPNHQSAIRELFALLCDLDRLDDAMLLARQYLERYGPSSSILDSLAKCQMKAKRFDEAVATARQAVQIGQTSYALRETLIHALKGDRKSREARVHIDSVANIVPDDPIALVRFAELALWAGRKKLAQSTIERAFSKGDVPDYYRGEAARMLLNLRRFEAARTIVCSINVSRSKDSDFVRKLQKVVDDLLGKVGADHALGDFAALAEIRLIELTSSVAQHQDRIAILRAGLAFKPADMDPRRSRHTQAKNFVLNKFAVWLRTKSRLSS